MLKEILSDFRRLGLKSFTKTFLTNPGFQYLVLWRICKHVRVYLLLKYTIYPLLRLLLHDCSVVYGIDIPLDTEIGRGFYIGHHGCIIVNPKTVIGNNCNISHDVTIGEKFGGYHPGVPVIGDNVYIGPGAKIIGRVYVGDNACIGAGSVVIRDVPYKSVVAGNPARVISRKGSGDYIKNTVPDEAGAMPMVQAG